MKKNPPNRTSRLPTIRDVAKLAGVSTSTVSNVLNKARYIRPETYKRVENAMKELDYRTNRVAQALIQQSTKTIGAIIPDIANPFFSELVRGVEDVLVNANYFVFIGNSDNNNTKERYYLQGFLERQVDGLILAIASGTQNEDILGINIGIPIVLVDRTIPDWPGDCVIQDNETGMRLAVNHLVSLGHKRIALINGDTHLSTADQRRKGFEAGLIDFNLSPVSISEGLFSVDSGYMQTVSLLHSLHQPATAICAGNDLLAIGAMRAIFEANLKIPDDISVIGYDDIPYANSINPGLTTISQPARSIGVEAVRLLLRRLDNPNENPQQTILSPKLIIRHSTANPRGT